MGVGTLEGWVVGSDVDGWDVGAVVDGFTRDRHSQILSSFALLQPMVPSFLAHASPFPSCHPLIQSIFYRPKKKQKEKKKINQIKKYKQKFKSFLLMGLNLMNNLFCFGFSDRFLVLFYRCGAETGTSDFGIFFVPHSGTCCCSFDTIPSIL